MTAYSALQVLVCVFGADMNVAVQDRKWTPLHFAVDNKHARIVSMLVRRGADVECEDKNRCVPAFLAKRKRAPECRQIITQHIRERTELLGRQAADVSASGMRKFAGKIGCIESMYQ